MTYIYAYSNHKYGLDKIRRMAVLYKELLAKGKEVEMLTNDFRAANVLRDYGVPKCTTIESVWDIDMVAPQGAEHLILDTPEDDAGKIEEYVQLFGKVTRVADCAEEKNRYTEELLVANPMVDELFIEANEKPKGDRRILFFGDSDHDKWLLENKEKLSALECDLLLGEYFFLGYEDELTDAFSEVYEAEEYIEIISTSRSVITFSMQCAFEANASGAKVIYVSDTLQQCQKEKLIDFGIDSCTNLESVVV